MDISVISLYNESDSLRELFQILKVVLENLNKAYEIIFVDDGSTDGSFSILEEIYDQQDHVQVIRLRRNFGKTAALLAGFAEARGERIATTDGDALMYALKRGFEYRSLVCEGKIRRDHLRKSKYWSA